VLPTFLIIGSQKAGTTSLYEVLRRHPDVTMARKKEIHFFIHDRLYRQGLARYERFFWNGKPDSRAIGEATPGYLCYPQVPERIRRSLPEARLVLTVRNPIERAHSQYWYARRHLAESLAFEEAVDRYLEEEYDPARPGYFSRGFYMRYIRSYLALFPREQLHVIRFEELVRDPRATYGRLFRFLGVNDGFRCPEMAGKANPSFVWRNPLYAFFYRNPHLTTRLPLAARRILCSGPKAPERYPPMDPHTRARLIEAYREPNRELGEFLGVDLESWSV
jgi:hypothetical protein